MDSRPRLLTILCSLSFIFAFYGLVSSLTSALSPPEVNQEFIDALKEQLGRYPMPIEDLTAQVETYYINLMLNFGNYGAANFLFYGVELIGVYLMYRLNKVGFTLYLISQIGLSITPAIFGGFNTFGQITVGITLFWNLIWITLYAFQLKHLR